MPNLSFNMQIPPNDWLIRANLRINPAIPMAHQVVTNIWHLPAADFEAVAIAADPAIAIASYVVLAAARKKPTPVFCHKVVDGEVYGDGHFDLANYVWQLTALRSQLVDGQCDGYIVLDGRGSGLTRPQAKSLAGLLGQRTPAQIDVRDVSIPSYSIYSRANGMPEQIIGSGITAADLAAGKVLYLPADQPQAALFQTATIAGLANGVWPRILRLGAKQVDEIVDLEQLRKEGAQIAHDW